VRPDRVAEERAVVPPPQAIAAAVLLVGPPGRKVGSPADLGENDRAVTDGGAEERVAALTQGTEDGVECTGLDDQGVAGLGQGPLQLPGRACKRNATAVLWIKPIEAATA